MEFFDQMAQHCSACFECTDIKFCQEATEMLRDAYPDAVSLQLAEELV